MDAQLVYEYIAKYGTYYYPASKHYPNIHNPNVRCDRCKRLNLKGCIGWEDHDLCMACVSIVQGMIHPNPHTSSQSHIKPHTQPHPHSHPHQLPLVRQHSHSQTCGDGDDKCDVTQPSAIHRPQLAVSPALTFMEQSQFRPMTSYVTNMEQSQFRPTSYTTRMEQSQFRPTSYATKMEQFQFRPDNQLIKKTNDRDEEVL